LITCSTLTALTGLLLTSGPASAAPTDRGRSLGLASDPNLRDVGGYRAGPGQWVRSGLVYRSQALSLSPADLAVVNTLGIVADYDLRTPAEATAVPDVVPASASYRLLNLLGTDSATTPSLTSPAAARKFMRDTERSFVTNASSRRALAELLTAIASGNGPQLYHCTAGKDRTGWATAVLLTLLGVPADTVVHDYLLSNRYYYRSPAVRAQLAAMPEAVRDTYAEVLEVEPSYLLAGLDQIRTSYGSMAGFAVNGLGLSRGVIAKLKHRLLAGRSRAARA
jgi:protein-tyrosine phosphatase